MATSLRRLGSIDDQDDDQHTGGFTQRRTTLLPPPPDEEERSGLVRAVVGRTFEDDVLAWLDESLAQELDLGPDAGDEEDDRPTLPMPAPDRSA